jgi:hypothetical protein
MTKIEALGYAIEEANSYLKGTQDEEETKKALEMVQALEELRKEIGENEYLLGYIQLLEDIKACDDCRFAPCREHEARL